MIHATVASIVPYSLLQQHEWSVVAPFLLQELARSEFASPRTFFFAWPIPPMYLALDEEHEQKCAKVLNVFRKVKASEPSMYE